MKFLYFTIFLTFFYGCMPKDKELEIEGARTLDVIKVLKYADQVTPKSESTLYFTLRISNLSNDSIELLRIKENCPQGSVLTGASVDIGSFDSLRKKGMVLIVSSFNRKSS